MRRTSSSYFTDTAVHEDPWNTLDSSSTHLVKGVQSVRHTLRFGGTTPLTNNNPTWPPDVANPVHSPPVLPRYRPM